MTPLHFLTSPNAGRSTREARRVGGCLNEDCTSNSTTATPTRRRADARRRPHAIATNSRKGKVSKGALR